MPNHIRATCSNAAAIAFASMVALVGVSLGCGDDGTETIFDGDPQVPPQGSGAVIDAWLAEATYKGAVGIASPPFTPPDRHRRTAATRFAAIRS